MRYLIELSGEAEGLAMAEAASFCAPGTHRERDGRALVMDSDFEARTLAARLGLAWSVSEHIFTCEEQDLAGLVSHMVIPGQSFGVRAKRLNAAIGPGASMTVARRVGEILSARYRVDLGSPDVELRILLARRCHVGILRGEVDRPGMEARKAENRPFNHPISLHPKLARALVNVTQVRAGQALLDPFCGTGGILLEAGLMGCKALGGDIDPRMVEGTRQNLDHFGVAAYDIREMDVSKWPGACAPVDAIATDPPYGRSASTAKESIVSLYSRAFGAFRETLRPGGRLAIVLPEKKHAELARGFTLEGIYPVRVHRSLTRYFCVFRS